MNQISQAKIIEQNFSIESSELRSIFSIQQINPIAFINTLISECINFSASDIFFEPTKDSVRVRARIDGILYELGKISHSSYTQISSRIKILGKLDSAERRRIQEGQFSINCNGKPVNLRLEIAQTINGELIFIRIHERKTIIMDLSNLGLNPKALSIYQEMLQQRNGLILVCGPTGCGKTTTLYSTIVELNKEQNYNIMTIEDPVEFQLEGVNQMQTNDEQGFTFASGLKTILRLSPDIVLVGEIRDQETAKIAVEAGLTGQLVLSTIHAPDSIGALFRLLDLGIESYFLNSSLVGILSQRLVRKLCPSCHLPSEPQTNEVDLFEKVVGRSPKQLYKGKGCPKCQNLAFQGRVGIFEVLSINSPIRSLIRNRVSEEELRSSLIKEGFITLLRDGLEKCELGLTTVPEVLRSSLRTI